MMELLKGKKPGGTMFTWIRLAALGLIISIAIEAGRCELEPTESQCRPYIEKALKEQHIGDAEKTDEDWTKVTEHSSKEENIPTDEHSETIEDSTAEDNEALETEESPGEQEVEKGGDSAAKDGTEQNEEDETKDEIESAEQEKDESEIDEGERETKEDEGDGSDHEKDSEGHEEVDPGGGEEEKKVVKDEESEDEQLESPEEAEDLEDGDNEEKTAGVPDEPQKVDAQTEDGEGAIEERTTEDGEDHQNHSQELQNPESEIDVPRHENESNAGEMTHDASETQEAPEIGQNEEVHNDMREGEDIIEDIMEKEGQEMLDGQVESTDNSEKGDEDIKDDKVDDEEAVRENEKASIEEEQGSETEVKAETEEKESMEVNSPADDQQELSEGDREPDLTPEEDLTKEAIIPENLRPRDHITQILRLDEESVEAESFLEKTVASTLKSLKALYDNAIKPLETLYKYRDLSNRHFGDPEIFSKPLILFMGPWSGGKSTTINYLLNNEFTEMSLRTGAEPSPAYFNILMYGNDEEVLDGTQLAADWTFSGLQKFGQSLLDRLKGYKLPSRLLEKVNIVEIPGILEIRKQVQRLFPFNDACQWFIDRADIIFLVYDPSKLDVGPETEAILDQLKGREYQTRIILNKADQVKPEELMRVQGTLIWNISPLMSSTEPPVMYTTSLWSLPYETGAPTRLLSAQEKAFLRDLRDAIDKRVENKIASARRFAVRVRNHAKMVDCYLTTYYNHKTFFGNKKKISDDIIENPQKYHIYEGLSTLTNISRYDLPDPDVYRDFFKLNSLYDFKKLSDTCTYFRGCPINTLDVAIAYDLPELVGKYKKAVEASKAQTLQKSNR